MQDSLISRKKVEEVAKRINEELKSTTFTGYLYTSVIIFTLFFRKRTPYRHYENRKSKTKNGIANSTVIREFCPILFTFFSRKLLMCGILSTEGLSPISDAFPKLKLDTTYQFRGNEVNSSSITQHVKTILGFLEDMGVGGTSLSLENAEERVKETLDMLGRRKAHISAIRGQKRSLESEDNLSSLEVEKMRMENEHLNSRKTELEERNRELEKELKKGEEEKLRLEQLVFTHSTQMLSSQEEIARLVEKCNQLQLQLIDQQNGKK